MNRLWVLALFLSLVINFAPLRHEKVLMNKMGTLPLARERLVQQEKNPMDPTPGLGTQEIPRADGGKDTTYYSITTPEEEKKAQQEEKEKSDKSWDVLKNVIIDRHHR